MNLARSCAAALAALLLAPALAAPALAAEEAPPAAVPSPNGDAKMPAAPSFVVAKFKGRLYGFAEADSFVDSTESLVDLQGNQLLAAPRTTAADAGRVQFSGRNTRLGFALESPEVNGLKATGAIESDFLGYNPAPGSTAGASEGSFYNGAFRLRHAWARLETPVVTIQAGQTWTLLAFNPIFTPGSVSLQGLPNEVFQRTPQVRLSRLFKFGELLRLELAAAAARPAQRDSAMPDFVFGARVEFPGWRGYKSTGSAAGSLTGLQLALSGTVKQARALRSAASDTDFASVTGSGIAVDAIVPIVPATPASKANALTFVGELASGSGFEDNFTGLSMGTSVGLPKGVPAGFTVTPPLDAGLAGFRTDTGAFTAVDWQSMLLNLQYYTPIDDGALWFNGIWCVGQSDNSYLFAKPGGAYGVQHYAAVGALYDPAPGFRVGVEWSWTQQRMSDDSQRVNRRGQLLFLYTFL
jgi:hypothetical protein